MPTFQWLNTEIFTETLKDLEGPYLCNVLDIGGSTLSVGSSECFSGSSKHRCKITGAATSKKSLSNEVYIILVQRHKPDWLNTLGKN